MTSDTLDFCRSLYEGEAGRPTEKQALAALPQEGWVRDYVCYAMQQTDAPLVYHYGVGVALLAASCPVGHGMNYAGMLRPNLYVMAVGRGVESRKTTALHTGLDLVQEAAPALVSDAPGTAEGIIASLSAQPTQICRLPEAWASPSEQARYVDVFDCFPLGHRTVRQAVRVEEPRQSILSAMTEAQFRLRGTGSLTLAHAPVPLLSRFLVLCGARERTDVDQVGSSVGRAALVQSYRERAHVTSAGACLGMDGSAKALWNRWHKDVMGRSCPERALAFRARAPALARKIALVLAWDYGSAIGPADWQMSVKVLAPALRLTELHLSSVTYLLAESEVSDG